MNIVIISAHPDDETLGAGGTMLKHKEGGDKLYWIITTKMKIKDGFSKKRIDLRNKEIQKVSDHYGIEKTFQLDYSTMSLNSESVNQIIPEVSDIFRKIEPNVIYCVNRTDAHSDHKYTFESIMACTKSFRFPSIKKVLLYECISETEFAPAIPERIFQPNYFVDISKYFHKKIDIMKIYESELDEHPFPRSLKNIEALSVFRGATAGVYYAEAFQLIKFIDK
ncbi:PIG-L family deacetylase [Flavobacteriaceae bacterium]|nr:PIG-L family deacetylase [Flavobacteriaceae bacterium]